MYEQSVAIAGKLYMRGLYNYSETVLVYTPGQDRWNSLPPPPVRDFALATLRGLLVVVGGQYKFTSNLTLTNSILTFEESSRKWVESLPDMPKALALPAVAEYQDYLVVIGGYDSNGTKTADVNILNTVSNKWIPAKPLPRGDVGRTCLFEDTLYLVDQYTKKVFRVHVPSLISQAGVWESVANVPFYWSTPVAIGKTFLAVGGSNEAIKDNATSSIYLYDSTKNQWGKCGDLLDEMYQCNCIKLSGKLYVLGTSESHSVYASELVHGSFL